MLALDYAALCSPLHRCHPHPPPRGRQWLREIAHKLDPPQHQRRTSAASSAVTPRRHAARQRAGNATCTSEYNAEVLDTLIALHWVSEQKASD